MANDPRGAGGTVTADIDGAIAADASIAVKWVVDEEFTHQAQALIDESVRFNKTIVIPPHFPGEVINAIYQRTRTASLGRHLDPDEAAAAVSTFLQYRLRVVTPPDLYHQAFLFARDHGLSSIYDSLYVVLAQLESVELWTADRRLLNALGNAAPWVRFIGDYPLP